MIIRLRVVFLFLLSGLIFSSCSLERKMAMEFIKQKKSKVAVLVVPPYYLDMYNNNEYNFDSIYIPDNFPLDSILFQQTKFLKNISDSVFMENYLNGFISRLRETGFRVFLPDELEAFKEIDAQAYIFKFAQVELNEEIYPYEFSEEVIDTKFYKVFELNLITLNSWFEFEARDTAWRKVFFAEDAVTDEFSADIKFDDSNKNPVLYYSIDSLSVTDIYQVATDVGKKYAGYLTGYLINSYVKNHIPANLTPSVFYQYDAEYKMLFPFEEGFLEITKEK